MMPFQPPVVRQNLAWSQPERPRAQCGIACATLTIRWIAGWPVSREEHRGEADAKGMQPPSNVAPRFVRRNGEMPSARLQFLNLFAHGVGKSGVA